jgi:hypothetical protein
VLLKPGVKLCGVSPEIVLALQVCETIYRQFGYELTVTSIRDGKHKNNSLHYVGKAVDLRTRNVDSDMREKLRVALQAALGAEFDVILEKDHFHCEFDVKGGDKGSRV